MVKARTWFTLFIISVVTVAATASCGSDEATGGGSGGTGGGGLLNGGAAGIAGKAGSVGRAGAGGGTVTATGSIGLTCAADSDCATGFVCLTPDSTALGTGGPANGMCTLPCTTNGDCDAVETGAGCINFGTATAPQGFCFESCTQDSPAPFDQKCQGRPDFTCHDYPSSTAAGVNTFCRPRCRADAECGDGLFCNRRSGFCSKTKNTGDPVGTACDPKATTPTCEGTCVGFPDANGKDTGKAFCAELCQGYSPCMYSADGMSPGGYCTGPLSDAFGPVDEGFCEMNCECTGDCKFPGDVCRAWETTTNEASIKTALMADGMCYGALAGSVELSCGEGGAGGAPSSGGAGAPSEAAGAAGASN